MIYYAALPFAKNEDGPMPGQAVECRHAADAIQRAAALVRAACKRGERCVYLSLEESPSEVMRNMRSIAIDLAEYGIRVNCIAPGHIPTGITNYDIDSVIQLSQPLQRHGSPQDVANAVLFLAGERSAQITGIVVPVDGGTTAGPPVNRLKGLIPGMQGGGDAG